MSDPRGYWNLVHAEDPDVFSTRFFRVAYGGGRWVAVGEAITTPGYVPNAGLVSTASDPDDVWSSQAVSGSGGMLAIAYGGGIWVAAGRGDGDNIWGVAMHTATNPASTWTLRSLPDPVNTYFGSFWITSIAFDGTNWAAMGMDGTVYTATDPTSSWTAVSEVFDILNATPEFGEFFGEAYIGYANSKWIAVVYNFGSLVYTVLSADDPNGSWTQEADLDLTSGSFEMARNIWFSDGLYHIAFARQLWASTSLGSGWTRRHYGDPIMQDGAFYGDGDIVVPERFPAVATAPEGPYEIADGMDDINGTSGFMRNAAFGNDEWVGVGGIGLGLYSLPEGNVDTYRGGIWSPAGNSGTGWGMLL